MTGPTTPTPGPEPDAAAAELAELEREFEAAGGRGVDLAERIDALRAVVHPTPDADAAVDANPFYPNGRCPTCGFGLNRAGTCTNAECTDKDHTFDPDERA